MALARFGVFIVALYLTAAQVVAQEPPTISIAVQTREDADSALRESLRDIRRELGRTKPFRVVDQPERASVILIVLARHTRLVDDVMTLPGQSVGGRTASGGPDPARTSAVTVPVQVERHVIDAAVRHGSTDHAVSAVDKTSRATARAIVKNVLALIQPNGHPVERQR